jgi:hypothetical protein
MGITPFNMKDRNFVKKKNLAAPALLLLQFCLRLLNYLLIRISHLFALLSVFYFYV